MNADKVETRILSDHKDLRGVLHALEQHLHQPLDSDGWLGNLREELCGLVDLCSVHFGLEEETGLHVELRERSPHLASRLERLVSDHGRILGALQKLVTDLPEPSTALNQAHPLKAAVLEALQTLREHERAENAIMMEAYWDDLGGESG